MPHSSPRSSPPPGVPAPKLSTSPKLSGCKNTVTRYRCGFPGCNKRYASTDGVRKHARKTHMAWLKAIDENAGSRDRQLESKPSTYCTMELVDADEAEAENLEPSPTLLPAAMPNMADIPALGLRVAADEPSSHHPPPMPDGLSMMRAMQEAGGAQAMSNAMASAAAAALMGAAPPPPLAWLFAQHMAASLAHGGPLPTPASLLPQPDAAMRSELPVAVAAASHHNGGMKLPPPPPMSGMAWSQDSMGLAASGLPNSPLAPLPAPGDWDDLNDLFARATDDILTSPEHDDEDRDKPGDPLCLSPPVVSAMAAVSVSPFELEKRPSGSPQTTISNGWEAQPKVEPEPEEAAFSAPINHADANAFLETLLASEC